MPLLDHFRPPLFPERHWESFHAQWAGMIADALNGALLPPRYFAEPHVHVGSRVEIDVGTFEREEESASPAAPAGEGGTATLPARVWAPPAPDLEMPAVFPDSIEVLIYKSEGGATLVAAVELISPGNKDRQEARRAFAAKCATYLSEGVGVVTVDIVTDRHANLHNELVRLMDIGERFLLPPDVMSAVAYRPVRQPGLEKIDVWHSTLSVGSPLPVLPLALDHSLVVPLDLEATYTQARRSLRLA